VERATARFYYDDQWRVIAEYDGSDNLTAKYVYGPGIDEPVRMNRNGSDYYYHAAALGNVTEMTSADGVVMERYRYDVYGTPEMRDYSGNLLSSSALGNRLLFQGRDRDPDTGLYNFRNRYYSPSLGRFLQVDPVRTLAGINLYRFARNNPVIWKDSLGLYSGYQYENQPPTTLTAPFIMGTYPPGAASGQITASYNGATFQPSMGGALALAVTGATAFGGYFAGPTIASSYQATMVYFATHTTAAEATITYGTLAALTLNNVDGPMSPAEKKHELIANMIDGGIQTFNSIVQPTIEYLATPNIRQSNDPTVYSGGPVNVPPVCSYGQ
jgi:RHS repeat-associated protein